MEFVMNSFLKTTVLAAALTATSLVFLPAANAQNFTYYPDYDLYRLPNGSLAVNPAAVAGPAAAPAYGITAPAYGMTAPAYGITAPAAAAVGAATYGITAPAAAVAAGTYGITAPAYGATGTFGVTNYSTQSFMSPVYPNRYAVAVVRRPGSSQWLAYCEARYRTFDPASGTFIGFDGQQHLCR
jgi:hypothetical protein